MVMSGLFATAIILRRRADANNDPIPMISARLDRDCIERFVNSLMATWWLALSLNNANMAYVFRDETYRCMVHETADPESDKIDSERANVAPSPGVCAVFKGSVALPWIIWLLWVIRMCRSFTRSNLQFDSRIFSDTSEPIFDSYINKCPRLPAADGPSPFSPSQQIPGDTANYSIQHLDLGDPPIPNAAEVDSSAHGQQQQQQQQPQHRASNQQFQPQQYEYCQYCHASRQSQVAYNATNTASRQTNASYPLDTQQNATVRSHLQNVQQAYGIQPDTRPCQLNQTATSSVGGTGSAHTQQPQPGAISNTATQQHMPMPPHVAPPPPPPQSYQSTYTA
ncbi:hypothetical protein GGI12_000750 [Dipsacomyces acuminosporus]|nr:hypothetical protein GGI12_000750 [Dipsacomyces acuminosporus]